MSNAATTALPAIILRASVLGQARSWWQRGRGDPDRMVMVSGLLCAVVLPFLL